VLARVTCEISAHEPREQASGPAPAAKLDPAAREHQAPASGQQFGCHTGASGTKRQDGRSTNTHPEATHGKAWHQVPNKAGPLESATTHGV
jgi:hypothetical protein